jgi:hypothetical protein
MQQIESAAEAGLNGLPQTIELSTAIALVNLVLLVRRGADEFLACSFSHFPIYSTTKRIVLGWVKEVRTTKS